MFVRNSANQSAHIYSRDSRYVRVKFVQGNRSKVIYIPVLSAVLKEIQQGLYELLWLAHTGLSHMTNEILLVLLLTWALGSRPRHRTFIFIWSFIQSYQNDNWGETLCVECEHINPSVYWNTRVTYTDDISWRHSIYFVTHDFRGMISALCECLSTNGFHQSLTTLNGHQIVGLQLIPDQSKQHFFNGHMSTNTLISVCVCVCLTLLCWDQRQWDSLERHHSPDPRLLTSPEHIQYTSAHYFSLIRRIHVYYHTITLHSL